MGGEHQLDLEVAHPLEDGLRVDPLLEEPGQRMGERPPLRRRLGIALILSASPHAVMLFGNVGEGEEVCERPGNGKRIVHRQLLQQLAELVEALGLALTRPFRQRPDALDGFEERDSLLPAQGLPEEVAEESNVVAERKVRVFGHGAIANAG